MAKHVKKEKTVINTPKKEKKSFDFKKTFTISNFKKVTNHQYFSIALILLLIAIPIIISTHYRMFPADLEVTEQWAWDSYRSQLRGQVSAQISSQYPNLPQAQRDQFVNQQLDELVESQREQIAPQVQQTADFFKSQLQNDDGQTYLLAIDPYLWHTYAKNYEANGYFGNTEIDGESRLTLRNGREGQGAGFIYVSAIIVYLHKVISIFNPSQTLLNTTFLLPPIVIGLAIIFAFFLGRKIAGNVGGFVAGLSIALNTALLARTPAGFSDTDAFIVFFPLLITWLFFEAFTTRNWKKKIILTLVAAFAWANFAVLWTTGWHIATILLATAFIYFIYNLIRERKYLLNNKMKFFSTTSGRTFTIGLVFFFGIVFFAGVMAAVTGGKFSGGVIGSLNNTILLPFSSLNIKDVAQADIWPNVLTTVAELNAGSWGQILNSLGGKIFFWAGIVGVLLTLLLKNKDGGIEIRYATLLTFWFVGLTLASLISARFIALLAAPFAIAMGCLFGILWKDVSKYEQQWLKTSGIFVKLLTLVFIVVVFWSSFAQAEKIAYQEVPSMNDDWYDTLITIKDDSAAENDGIITSWWDFGHWFVNVAERRVTFDGGNQGRRIHWVGNTLTTTHLQENKDILRMLNCGQDEGYRLIKEELEDSYQAVQLTYAIIAETRAQAEVMLANENFNQESVQAILEKTHCADEDLLPQYFIASEDMVGKAGVWSHFGSWNFTRANIYNIAKNNDFEVAVAQIQELGISQEEAEKFYFEVISLTTSRQVDSWISPWPSYLTSRSRPCNFDTTNTDVMACPIGQGIGNQQGGQIVLDGAILDTTNLKNSFFSISVVNNGQVVGNENLIPFAVSYDNGEEIQTVELEGATFPYEIVVVETESGYRAIVADPLLARSAFTFLFYFDGKYMDGYEKLTDKTSFTGQRIISYKVNLENGS